MLLVNEHAIYDNRAALRLLFLQQKSADSSESKLQQTEYSAMLEKVLQIFYDNELYEVTAEDLEALKTEFPVQGAFQQSDTAEKWSMNV